MNIESAFMDTDTRLMLGLKEGKEFCMGVLLERYQRPVTQYIYHRIGNRAIAEELTQNVFLRIFSARKTYQPTATFTSWLFRIANHLALNWMRDHRNEATAVSLSAGMERDSERPIADRKPTAEEILLQEARLGVVRQAIDALPQRQRIAVLMQRYKDLEYSEIADAMHCSTQTVKALLFRAHNTLREQLTNVHV